MLKFTLLIIISFLERKINRFCEYIFTKHNQNIVFSENKVFFADFFEGVKMLLYLQRLREQQHLKILFEL